MDSGSRVAGQVTVRSVSDALYFRSTMQPCSFPCADGGKMALGQRDLLSQAVRQPVASPVAGASKAANKAQAARVLAAPLVPTADATEIQRVTIYITV